MGFISGWISIFSRFQFEDPIISTCLLTLWQLHQLISMVIIQGIHLTLHGTIPLLTMFIHHCFFKAFRLTFIYQQNIFFGWIPARGFSLSQGVSSCFNNWRWFVFFYQLFILIGFHYVGLLLSIGWLCREGVGECQIGGSSWLGRRPWLSLLLVLYFLVLHKDYITTSYNFSIHQIPQSRAEFIFTLP